jgi:drug/metabolite transporter (DMT)-like permease
MWKAVLAMFIGTMIASIGDGLLSRGVQGLNQLDMPGPIWTNLFGYGKAAFKSPYIILGLLCHISFFASLLVAFSWADLSLVLPITAFTYVFAAFIAKIFLHEDVNYLRWIGTVIIVIGVSIVLLGGADEKRHAGETQTSQNISPAIDSRA